MIFFSLVLERVENANQATFLRLERLPLFKRKGRIVRIAGDLRKQLISLGTQ